MPTLFLIILLSSVIQPGFWWLLGITVLFGWMALVSVVRAEFLRTRNFDYIRAAQALGVSDRGIMLRHMLPQRHGRHLNSTAVYFVQLGRHPDVARFSRLRPAVGFSVAGRTAAQGKNNLQAPATARYRRFYFHRPAAFAADFLLAKRCATRLILIRRCKMTSPLLTIDSLTVAFRQQNTLRTVVSDLSLRIDAGETLALVGESGSGKSVSALSILRLLPSPPVEYPSGDILFHGESLLHASERTLRGVRGNKIAMIFRADGFP